MNSKNGMRKKITLATAFCAVASPLVAVAILCLVEPELSEAILGGLIVGCVVGSVFGVASLVCNKKSSRIAGVLSAVPLCVSALFLALFLAHVLYG